MSQYLIESRKKSSSSGRISWKDVKKQQNKELRERQSQQSQPPQQTERAVVTPKATANPW